MFGRELFFQSLGQKRDLLGIARVFEDLQRQVGRLRTADLSQRIQQADPQGRVTDQFPGSDGVKIDVLKTIQVLADGRHCRRALFG